MNFRRSLLVADIVWTLPAYSAGRFTKSEVFELPFVTKSAKGSSEAFWHYVQKNSLDMEGLPAIRLQEFAKSHLDAPDGQMKFANSPFALVMNHGRMVDDDWVKEVNAEGANGKALLDEARALIQQYDK